ncbi:membrane-anchored protein [Oryzifoliimicrobium ureilyticus]|uniref:membrane-anchored protein n=1 Tax=Oryzifoliimicrobium ureilyticus TaxID=3113724 RepID=UPI0030765413
MSSRFTEVRKRCLRNIRYTLTRPSPPPAPSPFNGPVLVLGSAPVSHKPERFDSSFSVITINGSQSVLEGWGIEKPDITFMRYNQVKGTAKNPVEVRRVLRGKSTGALYVMLWPRNKRDELAEGLRAFDYSYDQLHIVNRYARMSLLDRVAGFRTLEMDDEAKCSNGVTAVLFALYHKAPAVIISGINPNSSGHIYNSADLHRQHTQMDMFVLRKLLDAGHPIFTADPTVAAEMNMPLWK